MDLAKKHQCKLYDWNKVLANEFHGFDVIISAVGNYHHLIQNVDVSPQKLLLIDLALPSNIDKALSRNEHILFHDLDSISAELDDAREKRLAAIGKVDKIIDEELSAYIEWCQEAPLRALLAEYKLKVNKEVLNYFEARKKACDLPTVQTITNVIIRKSLKRSEVSMPKAEMEAIITEHASILQKTNS
jgi:glutamyl-tRNA reductase